MENINDKKPIPPQRKYVSIFCIDGEPILPPLMTSEKRREMQALKENALKIEQRLKERKIRVYDENVHCIGGAKEENSHSTLLQPGNISQRSQEYYESKLKETEESMVMLKNLIQKQQEATEENSTAIVNTGNNSEYFYRDQHKEKLQKLKKSEILIYDNSTNEVIQVPAEKTIVDDQRRQLRETECHSNLNFLPNKKPSQLLLAGINSKGMTAIPSICLNPPTPLTANKSLCENFNDAQISDSLTPESQNQSFDFSQDLSSDESCNSMITQSDKKSSKHESQYNKLTTKEEFIAKNVTSKIQQYEAISSDNTPQTSPKKMYKNRGMCFGTPSGTMNRSATSPSIKVTTINRSYSSRPQSLAQDSDNSPENALVRSSSFTLECPSKALIEHMQNQKSNSDSKKAAVKSPLITKQNLSRKPLSSPIRAYRDTVESKAKKVQKVELKSSKPKIQQKPSQSKLTQTAAASISPYNTSAQHTNSMCRIKRSSYDISKSIHTSHQALPKTCSTQMRKSNSTSSNLAQTRNSKSRLTLSAPSSNSIRTPETEQQPLTHMDKTQKEKFLQLLAQQEEEQRRLQHSFEMQQKLLIEQLNREMAVSQFKSPSNTYNSSSSTPTSHRKLYDQQQILPRQLNQVKPSDFSLDRNTQKSSVDTFDLSRRRTKPDLHPPASPSFSNNSSSNSYDNNLSKNLNSHQHSSYGSQFAQSSLPIPVNNSHLSSMDQSNANTSLDISTISPNSLCSTATIQNNTFGNKSTPMSRRRLFSTEAHDVGVDRNHLNSPSVASSTYTSTQSCVEQGKLTQHPNQTNDSNRHTQTMNSSILHAAATKINAYARGFLVRRLFQTEQIQRIVQTIRDTLIFVLNLHIETIENPEESQTPANIKLKARLLQQLSSACRTLHLVFFQTSITERMEIIARDRKRIKTKLMSMNRKRIVG